MQTIQLYFQVHQPYRLGEYTFFDLGSIVDYFNKELNAEIIHKVSNNCYLPTNDLLARLIKKYNGKFKITFSFSGVFFEQIETIAPHVLVSFQELIKTGCVEILAETYYHSLASIYDADEFIFQVQKHSQLIKRLFNYTPTVFRNSELVTHLELIKHIEKLGFKVLVAEGTEELLQTKFVSPQTNNKSVKTQTNYKPNQLFTIKDSSIKLLCRNFELSDEIAYRYSDENHSLYPLTADKFIKLMRSEIGIIPLFMDYETFGEHHAAETGIFAFLEEMVKKSIENNLITFNTISEVYENSTPVELDINNISSWADTEKDLSAWAGNTMQQDALNQIYELKNEILKSKNYKWIDTWRRLQTSDHFYYMSTKHASNGEVHSYFSPFRNSYDAYLFYTNILKDLRLKIINY